MQKTLKIAIIIDTLNGGGAEKVCLTLANSFSKLGHKCHLIVLKKKQSYCVPPNIDFHFIFEDEKTKLYRKDKQRHAAKAITKLNDDIASFDLTFVNLTPCFPIVELCQFKNCFYVIHNSVEKELRRSRSLGPIKYFRLKKQYKSLENKKIITVSKGLEKEVNQLPWLSPSSVNTIYNPLDLKEIDHLKTHENAFSENSPYIIHIGRFAAQKRHDILFDAFKKMDTKYTLVLVCPKSKKLDALINKHAIQQRVIVTDFQKNPYPLINNAAALVLSSDFEGFGMVIAEALACQTPVASTQCPHGPDEILCDELAQFLVPVGDSEALSQAIESAIEQKALFEKSTHIEQFSVSSIASKYVSLSVNPNVE